MKSTKFHIPAIDDHNDSIRDPLVWLGLPAVCACCNQPTCIIHASTAGKPSGLPRVVSEELVKTVFGLIRDNVCVSPETSQLNTRRLHERVTCSKCNEAMRGRARAYFPMPRDHVAIGPYCLTCVRQVLSKWPNHVEHTVWVSAVTQKVIQRSRRIVSDSEELSPGDLRICLDEPLF